MTVRELSKLYYIQKLIERDKQRLADLESRLQPGGMNMSGMPHSPSPKNMMEEIVPLMIELKTKIRLEMEDYLREQRRLEEFIKSVSDYQMRLILLLRFVDLLSWEDIAKRIGGNNTADGLRKACNRFLQKTEKK